MAGNNPAHRDRKAPDWRAVIPSLMVLPLLFAGALVSMDDGRIKRVCLLAVLAAALLCIGEQGRPRLRDLQGRPGRLPGQWHQFQPAGSKGQWDRVSTSCWGASGVQAATVPVQ